MPSLRKRNMLDMILFSKKRKMMDLLIKRKKRKMNDVMPLTRCSKNLFECWIDKLPDELLVVILSCLNFHEAVRTCILSRRWRYLWKYTTCNIQFYNEDTWKFEAAEKFINSVNQALKFHQRESIEQFKVGFVYPSTDYLLNGDTEFSRERLRKVNLHIDGWINFAMAKQVKVFELNMGAGTHDDTGLRRNYSIRHVQKLLSISGEINLLRTLTTLKSLRFVNIRITQRVVEFILSHCPLLEQLCISASDSLKGLKVAGSLLKLKSIEISNCDSLMTMKIRAPGLVSFTYIGRAIEVSLKKVPLLSELTIGGDYARSFIFYAHQHSSYCRNLEKLKLKVSRELSQKCWDWIPDEHPQLCNLKELELDINLEEDEGLCFFAFLIMCSPQLSRLTIKLSFFGGASRWVGKYFEHNHFVRRMKQQRNIVGSNCEIEVVPRSLIHWVGKYLLELRAADNAAREATEFHHQCLEVVKLVGFIGCSSDAVFALHLLQIAPSLKKMIIDTEVKDPHISPLYNKKAIRMCVEQLNANLPAGAELLTSGPGFMEEN